MGLFDNITQATPLVPGNTPLVEGPSGCYQPQGNPLCVDPEWAADHPSECPDAPTITGLKVLPSTGTTQVNRTMTFAAFLTFSDGREKEVTALTSWSSNLPSVATINTAGVAKGVAEGIVTVTGSYRGYSDYSQLTVEPECYQAPLDIALVFDRSGSMAQKSADGTDRLAKTKAAARALTRNIDWFRDRVAVVSFNGTFKTTPAQPNAHLECPLWGEESVVLEAIDSIQLPTAEECETTGCATGIGGGLELAQTELAGERGREEARKVVVLMTDGMENIWNPDPEDVADEIKADGWVLVVIALAVPTIHHAYLQSLTNCDLFFSAETAEDLPAIYSRIPALICAKNNDECIGYYFEPPTEKPTPAGCNRDRLDYDEFAQFDVTGFVDLVGRDLYPLFVAKEPFVDLVGTGEAPHTTEEAQWLTSSGGVAMGGLVSKTEFVFEPGLYEWNVRLRGNYFQQRTPGDTVVLAIGSGPYKNEANKWFRKTVTITDHRQGWTDYKFQFRVDVETRGKVMIGQLECGRTPQGHPPFRTVGSLLREFSITNLTQSETIIEEDFEDEGACP